MQIDEEILPPLSTLLIEATLEFGRPPSFSATRRWTWPEFSIVVDICGEVGCIIHLNPAKMVTREQAVMQRLCDTLGVELSFNPEDFGGPARG